MPACAATQNNTTIMLIQGSELKVRVTLTQTWSILAYGAWLGSAIVAYSHSPTPQLFARSVTGLVLQRMKRSSSPMTCVSQTVHWGGGVGGPAQPSNATQWTELAEHGTQV